MVTNHPCYAFEHKYLMDYRVLKICNESTLPLVTSNAKESKININDAKPCTTLELIENDWNLFLSCIKTKHQNDDYNLRPCE